MDTGAGHKGVEIAIPPLSNGMAIYDLAARLYPVCRSLAGDGVRETLAIIGEHLPLTVHQVPTGTLLYDWKAPQEWIIREAYIADMNGNRIVDFARHNLHVVNFSVPVRVRMPLNALKEHIHTLPDQPDLIPYRTCYHAEGWGFCMTHNGFLSMQDGDYDVVIDAERRDGFLTFGEFIHRGNRRDVHPVGTSLPPVAGQRQLFRAGAAGASWRSAAITAHAPDLSAAFRPSDFRRSCMAKAE